MDYKSYHKNNRTAIVMPVYNEAESIEETIRELHSVVVKKMKNVDIWIFEDGSTDGTKEILEGLKEDLGNLYIKMDKSKKGYPKAMREALLSINPDLYDFVLSMDSDGQYDPVDFFKLWKIMQKESPDIVMGRRVRRAEPFYRRFLSWGLRVLEGFMFPLPCKDVTSAMRLMKVEVAHEIAKEVKYSKYNFWLEFTAWMSLKGYKVAETPVSYRERIGGSKVYSIRKMPKVVLSEFKALRAVKKESKARALA